MTARQWKNLLRALYNGNCILMLGPAVSSKEKGDTLTPFSQIFAKKLAQILEEERIEYVKEHQSNLPYIAQLYEKIEDATPLDAAFDAQDFYSKQVQSPNSIHKMLADLPFHLIINTSPDDLMFKAMKKAGRFQTSLQYYNFNKKRHEPTLIHPPTKDNPLVYNIFGYYEDPESLVLNQTQQVVFTSAIVQKQPRIPDVISSQFDDTKTYLFLGFNWEEWHLPLLLNSFNLLKFKKINIFSPQYVGYPLKRMTQDFYKNSFRFKFVDTQISTFLTQLKNQYDWGESQRKNVFISAAPNDAEYKNQLCKNLKILERTNQISIWHKGKILPGEDKLQIVQQKISTADLILLFISPDFWSCDELYNQELPLALQQYHERGAKVVPIITCSCNWESMPELCQLQPILPIQNGTIGKAIDTWENPDDAYRNIVETIKQLL